MELYKCFTHLLPAVEFEIIETVYSFNSQAEQFIHWLYVDGDYTKIGDYNSTSDNLSWLGNERWLGTLNIYYSLFC